MRAERRRIQACSGAKFRVPVVTFPPNHWPLIVLPNRSAAQSIGLRT
jgi:hypothetical protein